MSAFQAGPLRELGVALVRRNKVVYRLALSVCASAAGTSATPMAVAPTLDVE
jgi:hypothetical protein